MGDVNTTGAAVGTVSAIGAIVGNDPVDKVGEAVGDTGDAVGDNGDAVGDNGDAVGENGDAVGENGEVAGDVGAAVGEISVMKTGAGVGATVGVTSSTGLLVGVIVTIVVSFAPVTSITVPVPHGSRPRVNTYHAAIPTTPQAPRIPVTHASGFPCIDEHVLSSGCIRRVENRISFRNSG